MAFEQEVNLDCELLDFNVQQYVASGDIINIDEAVSPFVMSARSFYVQKETMDWAKSISEDHTSMQMCGMIASTFVFEAAAYISTNSGVMDRSQFFLQTPLETGGWLVMVFVWDIEVQETSMIIGLLDDMKKAGFVNEAIEGRLN